MTSFFSDFYFLLDHNPLMIETLAGIFGLMIGSFLNVVIYRAPIMIKRSVQNKYALKNGNPQLFTEKFNLAVPRSACPNCGHQISSIENIPIISYLFLKGRCRGCKSPISMRYPCIELLCAVLSFAAIALLGPNISGLLVMMSSWILIVSFAVYYDS